MPPQTVYLAGIGEIPLSAIPRFRDMLAAFTGQSAQCRLDEAKWLVRECGFRL